MPTESDPPDLNDIDLDTIEFDHANYRPPPPWKTTCWNCCERRTCQYAWDPYNTDGDCLADK